MSVNGATSSREFGFDDLTFGGSRCPYASDPELNALWESLEDVLGNECDHRTLHDFIDGKNELDSRIWRQAADLGWLAVALPEQYSGVNLGQRGLDLLHRQLGRWLVPGTFISTLAAAQWLVERATEEIKSYLLPRIGSGEIRVAVPATPCFDDSLALKDGHVSGRSPLLLGSLSVTVALIPVKSVDGQNSWALIATDQADARLELAATWDRTREMVVLDCADSKPIAIIGDPHAQGLRSLLRQLALAASSDSVGGANAISSQTIAYLKTRVQFDRPIGSFQALKHRTADLVISIAAAESLLEQAIDSAVKLSSDVDMWGALSKAEATRAYSFVAADCILLHGGVGFTWEYDCHLFLKRARLNETLGMSNPKQLDFAATELMAATQEGRSTAELK